VPAYHTYLHRADLRIKSEGRGPRLLLSYSHYRLWRTWWFVWRWEATYRDDTNASGLALGKASARRAARTWLRNVKQPASEDAAADALQVESVHDAARA